MKRRRTHLLFMLIGTLTLSLISTTSYALYRTAMGPQQCCKSHCRRDQPTEQDAKRCCKTHLTVLRAAASKALSAKETASPARVSAVALPSLTVTAPASWIAFGAPAERGPPTSSLLAQHTSLLR